MCNEEALGDLQSPRNLDTLSFEGYGADNNLFLNWFMSFTKLKSLLLCSWFGLESLCLGKLPYLESLSIMRLNNLRRSGDDFLRMGSDNTMSSSSSSSVALFPNCKFFGLSYCKSGKSGIMGVVEEGEKISKSCHHLFRISDQNCGRLVFHCAVVQFT